MKHEEFRRFIIAQGKMHYRSMPWRDDTRAYYVLVSELMLQQTQVARVVSKFEVFIKKFPNETSLAAANLAEVIMLWQGLGYNRRAKYLHEAAKMIVNEFGGTFPQNESDILKLPGVGKNTCGAIRAYAFNQSAIFVETNIRTVYIHHFFKDNTNVSDKQILEKLECTIDDENPRRFYQALMDYGSWLKRSGVKNTIHSKHYRKQPKLEGSIRQMRGRIILYLIKQDWQLALLKEQLQNDARFDVALEGLIQDGMIMNKNNKIHLTK